MTPRWNAARWTRALLRLLLFALAAPRASAAPTPGVVVVSNSRELYVALGNPTVSVVHLTGSIELHPADWDSVPLYINRNVTVAAHPAFQAIQTYARVDMASMVARVYLAPGCNLTFRGVELVNYMAELAETFLLIGPSPGARVIMDRSLLRREAGFPGTRNLVDLQALPRLGSMPGNQVAFYLSLFCYNTTTESRCAPDTVYVVNVATPWGPARSVYYAPEVQLGSYELVYEDTVVAVDFIINSQCLETRSDRDCAITLLTQLDQGPIILKSRPADSNLVKIVAALAILAVSVVLFLYFRRHYRSQQERRARRMRRLKEALGLGAGPEAPGVVFNGLEGEEPDWQLMPMPVGYAQDEEGDQPDDDLQQFIQDISNRPRREADGADANDVLIDMAGCPIAGEVGLVMTNASGMPRMGATVTAAGVAAAVAAAQAAQAGGGVPGSPCAGQARYGSRSTEVGPGVGSGAASTGRPMSGGVDSIGGHSCIASGQSNARVEMRGLGGAARHAGGQPVVVGTAAGPSGLEEGQLAPPPPILTTTASLALRQQQQLAAVAAAAGQGYGPGTPNGAAAAQGTPRGVGSPSAAPAVAVMLAGAPSATHRAPPTPAQHAAAMDATIVAAAGGNGITNTTSVAFNMAGASRQAITFTAADVAQRVHRSKDSGSEGKDAAAPRTQVGDLMDELEELRRDIMAGINDTQLQIMSVVGSGAFGTVYRGQWQGLEVAVKTVVFSASSENRKRALQEAALCQSINHRNIVATYAVDVQPLGAVNTPLPMAGNSARNSTLQNLLDWRLYIVQEFCDGGPLRKLVQSQYLQTEHGPNMPVICQVALELAHALAHLHSKNIIHGDLNPNNVLLKRDATSPIGFRVKMADFGLSVMVPIQKTHMSNLRLGTLYYIAPETCFRGQLGYAADVFSLGVMLWELYHGRLAGTRTPQGEPRYQPDFPDFPPACPPDYRKLAHRCLQKQPHNRLHSSQVVQRLTEMITTYQAVAAAGGGGIGAKLPPLPVGGPDEAPAPPPPPPPAAPTFATAHAKATEGKVAGAPTPAESRHSQRVNPTKSGSSGAVQPLVQQKHPASGSGSNREITPASDGSGEQRGSTTRGVRSMSILGGIGSTSGRRAAAPTALQAQPPV